MQQFALLFRMDISSEAQPSDDQIQQYMQQWMAWIGDIQARDMLESGNHLSTRGTVLYPEGASSNLPYTKDHESLAGYIIINADNEQTAIDIAQHCPILKGEGTSVEVRQLAAPGSM